MDRTHNRVNGRTRFPYLRTPIEYSGARFKIPLRSELRQSVAIGRLSICGFPSLYRSAAYFSPSWHMCIWTELNISICN